MTELIDKLVAEAGLTVEQASKTIHVIGDFVKEKFPMLEGAVDNLFGAGAAQASQTTTASTAAATAAAAAGATAAESGGWMDKISDFIPGEIGNKIEDFAKKAADTAEDLYEKGKTKAGDLYEKGKDKVDDFLH